MTKLLFSLLNTLTKFSIVSAFLTSLIEFILWLKFSTDKRKAEDKFGGGGGVWWSVGKSPAPFQCWKDWRQEEEGRTEDEMVGWHHQHIGREFEQALEDGERQGSLMWPMGSQRVEHHWVTEQQHAITTNVLWFQKNICWLTCSIHPPNYVHSSKKEKKFPRISVRELAA